MRIDISDIEAMIETTPENGGHRINRQMFTDPDILEMELKYIFEANWVYLAHESQLPEPHDFITTYIGRQPVIVNRNAEGIIAGFINVCRHRGMLLENLSRGNKKIYMCPFHGWCYQSNGRLVDCAESESAGYPENFDKDEFSLRTIAKIESYRGFIFGSLNSEVPGLVDHLGGARRALDQVIDQHPEGKLQVLPGIQTYTFDGNWKLQAENGVDGFHVNTTHANYVATIQNRQKIRAQKDRIKAVDVGGITDLPGGYYAFENGHVMIWNEWPNPEVRPISAQRDDLAERLGESQAHWMTAYLRNLLLYPNVFVMDQMSTQIRVFRPLAVDKTEVTTVCFAPEGEEAQQLDRRIRQYEDFFNPSGMATPDDLAAFNMSQKGFMAQATPWSDISRGALNAIDGPDENAKRVGLTPLQSGKQLEDEGIMLAQHTAWLTFLKKGMSKSEIVADGNK